jgi:hypothetical protein
VSNYWIFLGGLGDVVGALPKALARRGHRVMVVHFPFCFLKVSCFFIILHIWWIYKLRTWVAHSWILGSHEMQGVENPRKKTRSESPFLDNKHLKPWSCKSLARLDVLSENIAWGSICVFVLHG